MVFAFVIGFIERLKIVTNTSNYNVRTYSCTLLAITEHAKSSVFTSPYLVTDPNNVLCLRHYRLATVLKLANSNVDSQLMTATPFFRPSWLLLAFVKVKVKVKVKGTLRLAVYSQSVRLGFKPLETHDQTFFFN
jgi:hypothetical protein